MKRFNGDMDEIYSEKWRVSIDAGEESEPLRGIKRGGQQGSYLLDRGFNDKDGL